MFISVIRSSDRWEVEDQKILGWICGMEGELVDAIDPFFAAIHWTVWYLG